jgi:hypothetical protein
MTEGAAGRRCARSSGGRGGVCFLALALALGASPGPARAQTDASAPGETQVIEKIERGLFAALEAGPVFLVAPDAEADYGLGFGTSAHVGVDILPILNVSLGVGATFSGGSAVVDGTVALRDRLYVTPSVRAQLAVLTTERDFLWVRAEAGLGLLDTPAGDGESALEVGPAFGAAVGYEHFAVLRHFSFGAQAGLTTWLEPDLGLGVFVMPTLKYTF